MPDTALPDGTVVTESFWTPNVRQQVDDMNGRVTEEATGTISTGLLQQIVYLRDISRNAVPLEVPVSTSTYGNKIPSNFKIGF